jgi:hypothetical protein
METIDPFSDTRPVVSPHPDAAKGQPKQTRRKKIDKKIDDYFVRVFRSILADFNLLPRYILLKRAGRASRHHTSLQMAIFLPGAW